MCELPLLLCGHFIKCYGQHQMVFYVNVCICICAIYIINLPLHNELCLRAESSWQRFVNVMITMRHHAENQYCSMYQSMNWFYINPLGTNRAVNVRRTSYLDLFDENYCETICVRKISASIKRHVFGKSDLNLKSQSPVGVFLFT